MIFMAGKIAHLKFINVNKTVEILIIILYGFLVGILLAPKFLLNSKLSYSSEKYK